MKVSYGLPITMQTLWLLIGQVVVAHHLPMGSLP